MIGMIHRRRIDGSAPSGRTRGRHLLADPAQIPHDVEKRQATTHPNPEPKHQVTGLFPAAPQVTDHALVTLSR
jgi:hypothetical protein